MWMKLANDAPCNTFGLYVYFSSNKSVFKIAKCYLENRVTFLHWKIDNHSLVTFLVSSHINKEQNDKH